MIGTVYDRIALIDTSAAIALHDPGERGHAAVLATFARLPGMTWAVLDLTSHECFTTVRYARDWQAAIEHYRFFRETNFRLIRFESADEADALRILDTYQDHRFSFHDALCAAAMLRSGIYKILTLDSDFTTMGFAVLPPALH